MEPNDKLDKHIDDYANFSIAEAKPAPDSSEIKQTTQKRISWKLIGIILGIIIIAGIISAVFSGSIFQRAGKTAGGYSEKSSGADSGGVG